MAESSGAVARIDCESGDHSSRFGPPTMGVSVTTSGSDPSGLMTTMSSASGTEPSTGRRKAIRVPSCEKTGSPSSCGSVTIAVTLPETGSAA